MLRFRKTAPVPDDQKRIHKHRQGDEGQEKAGTAIFLVRVHPATLLQAIQVKSVGRYITEANSSRRALAAVL